MEDMDILQSRTDVAMRILCPKGCNVHMIPTANWMWRCPKCGYKMDMCGNDCTCCSESNTGDDE
jgi:tRNA(Ile2) C34 agmatinyltransferase TiaS